MKDVDEDMNAEQEITALGFKLDAFVHTIKMDICRKNYNQYLTN